MGSRFHQAHLPLIRFRSIDRGAQDEGRRLAGLGSHRPSPRSGNHRFDQREPFPSHCRERLRCLDQSNQGALINANDRFGHTPLHFTAYKGNARFLQFLLQNGGDPNARGRHDSTPLHSAAWGRNVAALEVLLEEGSDVDARTDEGETPGMTAALRGEKEILEILFALSADPHAEDVHGTNLIDLAAAGGHEAIVNMLRKIEPAGEPASCRRRFGGGRESEKASNGRKINERDYLGRRLF